jgi:hypothetical protein
MTMSGTARLLASCASVLLLVGCGGAPGERNAAGVSGAPVEPAASADGTWTRDAFGLAAIGKTRLDLNAAMDGPAATRTDSEGEVWYYRIKVRVPVRSQGVEGEQIMFPALVFRNGETECVLSGFFTPARLDDHLLRIGNAVSRNLEGENAKEAEEQRAFASGKSFQQLVAAWGNPSSQTVSSDGNGDAAWRREGLYISVYFDAGRTASVSIFSLP